MCIVKTVDARTTSAKLAAKMKADSTEERPKVTDKTTPEKQKVANTELYSKTFV